MKQVWASLVVVLLCGAATIARADLGVTEVPIVDAPTGTVALGFGIRAGTSLYRGVDNISSKAQRTVDEFADHEQLEPFFSEAIAYAVYPGAFRVTTGFGAGYGSVGCIAMVKSWVEPRCFCSP